MLKRFKRGYRDWYADGKVNPYFQLATLICFWLVCIAVVLITFSTIVWVIACHTAWSIPLLLSLIFIMALIFVVDVFRRGGKKDVG